MKRILVLAAVVLGLSTIADGHHKPWHKGGPPWLLGESGGDEGYTGNYDAFYSGLSRYGGWINCNYGRVWRPFRTGHQWRPYLNGRWIWTDYGWYWASYEPFGWAVYHYGRWQYDDYYGWIWIPDNVWGPAWVEWRYDNDYIGWAPLTPAATFSVSIGVTLTGGWVAPIHYWNFIPCSRFTATRIVDYVQPIERTRRFFGNTRGAAGIRTEESRVVNRGVDVGFIERRANKRINRVDVIQGTRERGETIVRDANRERIEVYRPQLDTRRTLPDPPVDRGRSREERSTVTPAQPQRPSYDEQQGRPPSDEQSQRDNAPRIRQFRESEQRFEIPRRAESERNRQEQIQQNRGRPSMRGNSEQQQPRVRDQQGSENRGRMNVEKAAPQVRERPAQRPQERSQPAPQSRGRGRKP